MSYEEPQRRPPAVDWLAESLRSTNFPSPGADYNADEWWHHILGQDPESRTVRPAAGERKEEGTFGGGRLALEINAGSIIQWTLSPTPPKDVPTEFLTVGRFIDTCDAFSDLMRRWYELAPRLNRIAFGAVGLVPVANRIEGYRLVAEYLHQVRIDPEGSSDLLYQINRRRPSRTGVERLEINRLAKWSVAELRIVVQAASAPGVEARLLPSMTACRAELDINTVQEFSGKFTPPASGQIFDELVGMAREILETGDRP